MRISMTTAAALLLIATIGAAQQTTPPPPAPPRAATLPQPVEKTLANGMRVIVIPKHDIPLVAARILIENGSEQDPPNLAGLADMTASLLTQGTKTRSAEEIARGVEALGATLSASAGWDQTSVDVSVMAPNFEKAMAFAADVVRYPSFKAEEIERMRQQSIDAIQVALRQPQSLARFVAARLLFPGMPYGHNTGGTPESLGRITREQIIAFHASHFRPVDAVLVVAGDVKPESAFRIAEKMFGNWTSGVPAKVVVAAVAQPATPRVLVIDDPDAGQAAVLVGRRGLKRIDPLYFPALVTNSVLGGGYSARLNEEIRIKRGLSYGAGSAFDMRREAGAFIASTQTKNESAAEVAGIIVDEMNRLATADVPESELTSRKAGLTGNFSRSLETSAGIADAVSELVLYGLPLDEIKRYIGGVQAVGAEDVKRFAASNLAGSTATVIIVGDARKFLEPLGKRFSNVEVIPVADLDLNVAGLKKVK